MHVGIAFVATGAGNEVGHFARADLSLEMLVVVDVAGKNGRRSKTRVGESLVEHVLNRGVAAV